jgi:hypothetical protein
LLFPHNTFMKFSVVSSNVPGLVFLVSVITQMPLNGLQQ